MIKRILFLIVVSTMVLPAFISGAVAHEYSHGSVEIDHPWSRPTPPGTPMGVGYLVIKNHSDADITLVGASTPRADRVSIHETLMKDGVMRMQSLKSGLTISAGEVVELKPHSYHLMLEKLVEPLKAGERIPLRLEFKGADAMDVELSVQSLDADMGQKEMDHSGHNMEH
ncbi:copper chaperone PCu(A)C [Marinobacter sp.]|uniref:copper chaperone PCu(A)C n=1 Tax=Marinobacter sp. TaxID=50741 RepID=UPI003A919223